MPNNMADNLNQVDNAIKTAIGIQNQNKLDRTNQQAASDAALAEARAAYVPSDNSGQFKRTIFTLQEKVAALEASVAEKDAMITEWMHSHEAFRRLAQQYGEKLEMTDEQRLNARNNTLVNVAEEDPKFANTKIGAKARVELRWAAWLEDIFERLGMQGAEFISNNQSADVVGGVVAFASSGRLLAWSNQRVFFGTAQACQVSVDEIEGKACLVLELPSSGPITGRLSLASKMSRDTLDDWVLRINEFAPPSSIDPAWLSMPEDVSLSIVRARHGGEYSGGHTYGMRSGPGCHIWATGYSMDGSFIEDALEGVASQSWADGTKFKGTFANGQRHGQGRHDLPASDGPVLLREGEYERGYLKTGRIVYKNGAIAEGSFAWGADQKYHLEGQGSLDLTALADSTILRIEGDFRGRNFQGRIVFKNGAYLHGECLLEEYGEPPRKATLRNGEELAFNEQGVIVFKGRVVDSCRMGGDFLLQGDQARFIGELLGDPDAHASLWKGRGVLNIEGVEIEGALENLPIKPSFKKIDVKIVEFISVKFPDGRIFEGDKATLDDQWLLDCPEGWATLPNGKKRAASIEKGVLQVRSLLGGFF